MHACLLALLIMHHHVMMCRAKFVDTLRERFAHLDLTFSVGGQISFDVFPRVRQLLLGNTAGPVVQRQMGPACPVQRWEEMQRAEAASHLYFVACKAPTLWVSCAA